jgi:AraC-like DNA-binding protein
LQTFASAILIDFDGIFAHFNHHFITIAGIVHITMNKLPQRPHLLKIVPPLLKSIVVKGDEIPYNNPWHYHPEIELLHCIKGKGTNFIGNNIRSMEEGEVLLIGTNVPHTRQRDRAYYAEHPQELPMSVVIQFREDFLGNGFFVIEEFKPIADLLTRALRGLKFTGATASTAAQRLALLSKRNSTEAILETLSILDYLARSEEFEYLNAQNYVSTVHEKSSQRINKVYHYTVEHFREDITLDEVAALTNHSPAAFCRYFKTRTRKTYVQYLTELRITYACELLMQGNLDIGQVCYESGFNNLSHFHKQFRRHMATTPSDYQKQSQLKVPKAK